MAIAAIAISDLCDSELSPYKVGNPVYLAVRYITIRVTVLSADRSALFPNHNLFKHVEYDCVQYIAHTHTHHLYGVIRIHDTHRVIHLAIISLLDKVRHN